MGNKTTASMSASANKAERSAIAETLEAKVASMGKFATAPSKGNSKGTDKNRKSKDTEVIRLPVIAVHTVAGVLALVSFRLSLQELTQEELEQKNFKDLQSWRGIR